MDQKFHRPKLLAGLAIVLLASSLILLWSRFHTRSSSDQASTSDPPRPRHSTASRQAKPQRPPARRVNDEPRSPRSPQSRPDIASQLADGAKITEGTVKGARIQGPVRVTGTFVPSAVTPTESTGHASGEGFMIVAKEAGEMAGPFSISASSATATNGGVQFNGPIRLLYQGDVGQWYEIRSDSDDSFFFLSSDGLKNLIGTPGGATFGSPDPSDPFLSGH